jgi:phosphatidylserine/phosphatidylglycerophosphate/cardiolipin synthase-like enzyme
MIIDQIFADLGGTQGQYCGVSYGLSEGNTLDSILPTPNLWGHNPAKDDYEPAARNLVDAIRALVSGAQHTVDIATLATLPDGDFATAIGDGIREAAKRNNITVRALEGEYYTEKLNFDKIYPRMRIFMEAVKPPPKVPFYVGAIQTGWASFNHSKLIIIDGQRAIAGGHNLWTETYCRFAPVHDISIQLSGPAVHVPQEFLNLLWTYIAKYSRTNDPTKWVWSRLYLDGREYSNALPVIHSPVAAATGKTRVLALGRLGAKLVASSPAANASRTARIAAVKLAQTHVRLSQQMLGGSWMGVVDEDFLTAICEHVAKGRKLSIVVSDRHAKSAKGDPYSGIYGVSEHAELIGTRVAHITGKTGKDLAQFLADHVQVAPLRFYDKQPGDPAAQSWKWRRGNEAIEPANHAKVYIVDSEAFYVGSDNAYAAPNNEDGLQEFGFLVSGEAETKRFLDEYWNKLWTYAEQFQYTNWAELADLLSSPPIVAL